MQETLIRAVTGRSLYLALLATAAFINAAGYVLTLWHDETVFDEVVHFFTSFAAVAAIGRLALEMDWLSCTASRWIGLLALGIVLGVAWEAVEYMIGIIGSKHDTLMDLLMDVAGALAATALIGAVSGRLGSS